jgi:amino-acid N-acetyltransferase
MLIRQALPTELQTILELAQSGGLLEAGIAERIDAFLLAFDGHRACGACGLEEYGSDGLLRTVVVVPAHRGVGLGGELVLAALERARQRQLGHVYLLTTTARDFFLSLGFRAVARETAPPGIRGSWEFSSGCPATAVLMQRRP